MLLLNTFAFVSPLQMNFQITRRTEFLIAHITAVIKLVQMHYSYMTFHVIFISEFPFAVRAFALGLNMFIPFEMYPVLVPVAELHIALGAIGQLLLAPAVGQHVVLQPLPAAELHFANFTIEHSLLVRDSYMLFKINSRLHNFTANVARAGITMSRVQVILLRAFGTEHLLAFVTSISLLIMIPLHVLFHAVNTVMFIRTEIATILNFVFREVII